MDLNQKNSTKKNKDTKNSKIIYKRLKIFFENNKHKKNYNRNKSNINLSYKNKNDSSLNIFKIKGTTNKLKTC